MKSLKTEIICVGTELLLGHVTNTDARDVSENLSKIGINVMWHTVVGDNPARLKQCIENAMERADIIVTTGGLGPTCDDITKQLLAESFGKKLVRDEKQYDYLVNLMKTRPYKVPDNVYLQADVIEGAEVFYNTCGTAPGCGFESNGKIVAMLPGPPKECRAMTELSLVPFLKKYSGDVIVSHSMNIFGISESEIDDMFNEEMNSLTNPTMAPYAKQCDCLVQVTAKGKSEKECEEMLSPYMNLVKEKVGEKLYGIDVPNLETRLLQLLKEKGKTIAISEHGTGGAVSARITALPESAGIFKGSIIDGDDISSLKADIVVDVAANEGDFSVKFTADGNLNEYPCDSKPGRDYDFMRQMAGNYAFEAIRRYLCRK